MQTGVASLSMYTVIIILKQMLLLSVHRSSKGSSFE